MDSLLSRRNFIAASAAGAAALSIPQVTAASMGILDVKRIARIAVHPAIGIARVGNSKDAFYFGAEVPEAIPSGPFKDSSGAMAKQAVRFRLYAYDADGTVLGEITAEHGDVSWRVKVGNAKAAWYGADEPLDIPQAEPTKLRNAEVRDRSSLAVVSRERRVSGAGAAPRVLDGGSFLGVPVTLGEITTDGRGRLIVFPGTGDAVSVADSPPLSGFADNDGWTDTTSDGPVHARVKIGGRLFDADPGWVLCAGPNYGPGIGAGLITLYDAVFSGLVGAGRRKRSRTEFHRDIAPIFDRMTDMQWVNSGYLATNGFGSLRDWSSEEWQARLMDRSQRNRKLRQQILAMFRDPAYSSVQPSLEPQEYGDMVSIPPTRSEPRQWLSLTPVQFAHLRSWARGDFTVGKPRIYERHADVPLQKRPTSLDRAALDSCLGGAFHPGVEFPWISRVPWMWTRNMRLKADALTPNVQVYGEALTPDIATSRSGPLSQIGPGDLVKWMGVPWQADAASCRFGYVKGVSPVLPTFWSARIPNSVLTAEDYAIVVDTDKSLEDRRAAFGRRANWERYITTKDNGTVLSLMVQEWFKLGVVRERSGPKDKIFPARMAVESRVGFVGEAPDTPNWYGRNPLSLFPLIVTNSDDNTLRSIDSGGVVSDLAQQFPLARPEGIASDSMGNLYVAVMDGDSIVRITAAGESTTIASGLRKPVGVACDRWGNVYCCGIGDGGWTAVIRLDGSVTKLITQKSGTFVPVALAVAVDGALLVADDGSNLIMRYDPLLTKMLNPEWITGLAAPRCMAWDAHGDLFVVERSSNLVSKFDPQGRKLPFTLQGIALDGPSGIAFDGDESMYVSSANPTANRVDRITLKGEIGGVNAFASGLANPCGVVFQGLI